MSDPCPTVLSPHDQSDNGSPAPKRTRLDPSLLTTTDLLDKSSTASHPDDTLAPARDSSDDTTPAPKGNEPSPPPLGSEGLSVEDSAVKAVCSSDVSSRAAERSGFDCSSEGKDSSVQHKDESSDCADGKTKNSKIMSTDDDGGSTAIMVCDVTVRKADFVKLEMSWVDGQNRELMQQLLQYFKNRLV